MVFNCVLYCYNLLYVGQIIEMVFDFGVDYLEFVNMQYYGWVMFNCDQLMLIVEQVCEVEDMVNCYCKLIGECCKILFVVFDYFECCLKVCMNGWGLVFFGVVLDGIVLLCYVVWLLLGFVLLNVCDCLLWEIWYDSDVFNVFCGDDWMCELCWMCDEWYVDYGGCWCQVYLLVGDLNEVDLVCVKFVYYGQVEQVVQFVCWCVLCDEWLLVFCSRENLFV